MLLEQSNPSTAHMLLRHLNLETTSCFGAQLEGGTRNIHSMHSVHASIDWHNVLDYCTDKCVRTARKVLLSVRTE